MLAAAPPLLRNEHMVVSLFENSQSAVVRRVTDGLVHLAVAGFCLLLIWEGFPAAMDNLRQVSPAVRIPMTIPYMVIPAGAALILIYTICLLFLARGALLMQPDEEHAQ